MRKLIYLSFIAIFLTTTTTIIHGTGGNDDELENTQWIKKRSPEDMKRKARAVGKRARSPEFDEYDDLPPVQNPACYMSRYFIQDSVDLIEKVYDHVSLFKKRVNEYQPQDMISVSSLNSMLRDEEEENYNIYSISYFAEWKKYLDGKKNDSICAKNLKKFINTLAKNEDISDDLMETCYKHLNGKNLKVHQAEFNIDVDQSSDDDSDASYFSSDSSLSPYSPSGSGEAPCSEKIQENFSFISIDSMGAQSEIKKANPAVKSLENMGWNSSVYDPFKGEFTPLNANEEGMSKAVEVPYIDGVFSSPSGDPLDFDTSFSSAFYMVIPAYSTYPDNKGIKEEKNNYPFFD